MRGFRNVIFLGIILSLIFTNFSFTQEYLEGYTYQEEVLMESIENMGAKFIELDIHCSGDFSDEFMTKEEVVFLGKEFVKKLGIKGNIVEKIVEKKGFIQYKIENRTKNPISITVSSYQCDGRNKGKTTIFVNPIKREKNSQINGIIEDTQAIFTQYGIKPEITTCIVGGFKGKLKRSDMDKLIIQSIKRVNGKIVDNYNEGNLISITAYTPIFKNKIYSGNEKMNYNLAMRYNEYEEKTYVWIGTPIITISY